MEVWKEIINLIENDLKKFLRMKGKFSDDDIADIIQETFIEVFKNISKLNDLDKFQNWILTILSNKCKKYKKKCYKEINLIEKLKELEVIYQDNYKEDIIDLYKEINEKLSYVEKKIFVLHYIYEYSAREISKILSINVNTIYTHLYRGKKKL